MEMAPMSKVPGISPQDIARLDQAHAEGNADLDKMVADLRERIADLGSTLAIAVLTAELQTDSDPTYLAAMAGLAIGRLAQIPAEPELAPEGRVFVEGFQPAAPVADEVAPIAVEPADNKQTPVDVCDRCSMRVVQVDGVWQHAEAADAVFCAVVMGGAR